jgi:hypothetical protein
MKSTNLYSGLAIILAAAANTAVVGCAAVTEDATDTESSVQSVSLPCDEEQNSSEAAPEQPAQGSEQAAPCNSGAAHQGNYSAPSGNCGASQGGNAAPPMGYDEPQQGGCGEQSGYGAPPDDEYGGYDQGVGVGVGGCAAPIPVPTYPVPVYYPVLVSPFAWGGWGGFGFGGFGRRWW